MVYAVSGGHDGADRLRRLPPGIAVAPGEQREMRAEQIDGRDLLVAALSQTCGARLPGRAEGTYSVTGSATATGGVPSGTTAVD